MNIENRCNVEAADIPLREWFDRLEAHGCNPRWLSDGSWVATCPTCNAVDSYLMAPDAERVGRA